LKLVFVYLPRVHRSMSAKNAIEKIQIIAKEKET
jgi:hypothetical protein